MFGILAPDCSLRFMSNDNYASKLQKLLNEADGRWSELDIWPKQGPTVATVGHIFLSSVLAIVGTSEAERASWTASDDGALIATIWTEDLVIQGSRGSADDALVTIAQSRKSLSAIRVHTPPVLSMNGWGIQIPEYAAELVYPEFTAPFRRRFEGSFLAALGAFRVDL